MLHLQIDDRNTTKVFQEFRKLAIDVLLGAISIDNHLLAILLEKRKSTIRDSNPIPIFKQENMSGHTVLN